VNKEAIVEATDFEFKQTPHLVSQTKTKWDKKTKQHLHACQQKNGDVEWKTMDEIASLAKQPSTHWTEVGYGHAGTCFVEILSCSDLPNLDVVDQTDPFAALCFEDSLVRTSLLKDTLDPYWMPWQTRAFAFRVAHASSLLMIGVFDCDQTTPLDHHDPVGRIVLNMQQFANGTEYNLREDKFLSVDIQL